MRQRLTGFFNRVFRRTANKGGAPRPAGGLEHHGLPDADLAGVHIEYEPNLDGDPDPGEIVQAGEHWEEPAGGGAVAAVQLARLAGECLFLTALGDDDLGHRAKLELEALGLRVEAAWRSEPQRRAFVHVDADAERTITVTGERLGPHGDDPLPWAELDGVDALLMPTSPTPAFRFGDKVTDPLAMYLADLFTIHANLCGVPALNLPAGFTNAGLPVGVQVMGRAGSEETLFRLGRALESNLGGAFRWPDVAQARATLERAGVRA